MDGSVPFRAFSERTALIFTTRLLQENPELCATVYLYHDVQKWYKYAGFFEGKFYFYFCLVFYILEAFFTKQYYYCVLACWI